MEQTLRIIGVQLSPGNIVFVRQRWDRSRNQVTQAVPAIFGTCMNTILSFFAWALCGHEQAKIQMAMHRAECSLLFLCIAQ